VLCWAFVLRLVSSGLAFRFAVLAPRSLRLKLEGGFVRKLSPGDRQRLAGARVWPARNILGAQIFIPQFLSIIVAECCPVFVIGALSENVCNLEQP
jgi:hypothetical protein